MISRKGMDVMELEMNVGKRIERGKIAMVENNEQAGIMDKGG